jgi:hypothetical protein
VTDAQNENTKAVFMCKLDHACKRPTLGVLERLVLRMVIAPATHRYVKLAIWFLVILRYLLFLPFSEGIAGSSAPSFCSICDADRDSSSCRLCVHVACACVPLLRPQ